MNLLALPAFDDNYIWMLHDGQDAVVVDPGDASPVIAALEQADLRLAGILVTHKHPDHVGGLRALCAHPRGAQARIWGPSDEPMPVAVLPVRDGDRLVLEHPRLEIEVMAVPGHTLGHLAYFTGSVLFCGDTLFSGGCGRLFEGTPAQMHASIARLAALPETTQVCCAHEYTLANLRFARAVEPHSLALAAYEDVCQTLRERGLPTLPSTIGQERQINPYMRCDQPDVIAAAVSRGAQGPDPVSVFATIRRWKDQFR